MLTILLDLNYTLVGNSQSKKSPFIRQIEQETYRAEIVNLVRPHRVFLLTARPEKYREATLARILEQTGWQPSDAYFNFMSMRPPEAKRRFVQVLLEQGRLAMKQIEEGRVVAIESNPSTRKMYADQFGILSLNISENKDGTPA